MVDIHTNLDVVALVDPREVVYPLIAVFRAMYEAEWLATEERDAGHINSYPLSVGGQIRVAGRVADPRWVEFQSAVRILEAELIGGFVVDRPRVTDDPVHIAEILS